MSTASRFEDLQVWQAARSIVITVYQSTRDGPIAKDFGFKDQLRRAAVSVMANIAEGFERGGKPEFIHFLYIAKGSAGEVRALLSVSTGLGYIPKMEQQKLSDRIAILSRQLASFITYSKSELPVKPSNLPKPAA